MIPGLSVQQIILSGGVAAIAAVVFAESGLLIGFFFPGDSLLFTAGFLVSQKLFHFDIVALCLILFAAAALGDTVGYEVGKHYGKRLVGKPDGRIFKQRYLKQADAFYVKHGRKAIVLARFVPIVRTFAPIVAGISKMPYRKFIAANLIGAALWSCGLTLGGYYLGRQFDRWGIGIDQVLIPTVLVIIVVSFLPIIIHMLLNLIAKRRQTHK